MFNVSLLQNLCDYKDQYRFNHKNYHCRHLLYKITVSRLGMLNNTVIIKILLLVQHNVLTCKLFRNIDINNKFFCTIFLNQFF